MEFDIVLRLLRLDPFVVVVHRNGQGTLRAFLPHHVLIQDGLDLRGFEQRILRHGPAELLEIIIDDVGAQLHALVADIHARTGYEPTDLILRLAAE